MRCAMIDRNRLNNEKHSKKKKPRWGIQRDKGCLACSFMPDGETGASWALMNHISIIEERHWKRKSDTKPLKPQTETGICLGADAACLPVNSVPSCAPGGRRHPLCHLDKSAAVTTLLRHGIIIPLSTVHHAAHLSMANWMICLKQTADEEVNGSLCVLLTTQSMCRYCPKRSTSSVING